MHIRRAMALKASFLQRTFEFGFAARTSRGAMRNRNSWFIKIWEEKNPEVFGIGEYGPLPGLSPEDSLGPEQVIAKSIEKINNGKLTLSEGTGKSGNLQQVYTWLAGHFGEDFLRGHPAITFALETAVHDLGRGGTRLIFDNTFVKGQSIPINGLVWMGGLDFMLQQIEIKIRDGFRCIKLKVGGLDFEKECDILQYIRRKYFRDNIVIRLDANGGFKPEEVHYRLNAFSRFDIHSIEQPLRTGSDELPQLCKSSPIPIALDEELIGISHLKAKEELLDRIRPTYLILKPTLHGGFFSCAEWITLAEERKIGWWITSALESNLGLNAISQFTANYPIQLPQGLGTGAIYKDNIPSPLEVNKGYLGYNSAENWDLSFFSF
jgi:O-succinylbenzoate synthase